MLYDLNNIIGMNRGDTFSFSVWLKDRDGSYYTLTGKDAVYLGVMDFNQPFEDAMLKKKFTVNDAEYAETGLLTITLNPEDTVDIIPGTYYYSIKLHKNHTTTTGKKIDEVVTIINKTKFIILE